METAPSDGAEEASPFESSCVFQSRRGSLLLRKPQTLKRLGENAAWLKHGFDSWD